MAEWRYGKQFKYVASEFEQMDVCASNSKRLIEFEVKISISDLKKELKSQTKIKKHEQYKKGLFKNKHLKNSPNYFYYVFPKELFRNNDKEIIEIVKNINENYGIITILSNKYICYERLAKLLHKKDVDKYDLEKISSRISSENIGLKRKIYEYKIDNKKGDT